MCATILASCLTAAHPRAVAAARRQGFATMPAATADLRPCLDCLRNLKPYELDQDGLCAPCGDRLARGAERPLPPPPWPTEHVPGTEGKLIVLEWRAKNGYGLWHPDDAQGHAPIETAGPSYARTAREPRVYRMAAVAG